MSSHPKLRGTDGVRGRTVVETGPGRINPETFRGLAFAAVEVLELDFVVAGGDTRPSTPRLLEATIEGAVLAGARVHGIDAPCPTPTIGWASGEIAGEGSGGLVITASHNPYTDNGLKLFLPKGKKPSDAQWEMIERVYWDYTEATAMSHGKNGSLENSDRLLEKYKTTVIESMRAMFQNERPLADRLIVVDTAYGAAKGITQTILQELGAEVITYDNRKDWKINDGCGANDLSGLHKFLRSKSYILDDPRFMGAIANDGDADRVMGVGYNGKELVEINGNHIMRYLAEGQPGIVGTEYTNSGLTSLLGSLGIGFEYCPNGDSHVTEALLKRQSRGEPWTRGGEFTGHLIDTDHLMSGDGIYMAAWFACTAATKNMNFGDIHRELPLWHEKMTGIPYVPKAGLDVINHPRLIELIEESRTILGGEGRLIVRKSGTEPKIRVWGEAIDQERLDQVTSTIARLVSRLAA